MALLWPPLSGEACLFEPPDIQPVVTRLGLYSLQSIFMPILLLSLHPILLLLLLLSRISHVRLCVTPEMAAHQAPLSLRFSGQEHWSGLPFPSSVHKSEK